MNFAALLSLGLLGLGLLAFAASPAPARRPDTPPVRLLHWAQFPVRVYLPAHGQGQAEEAQTVLAGFDEWVKASHGRVSYVRVSESGKAEITVQLVPGRFLSAETRSVGAVGETTFYSRNGTLKKADIRLAEGAGAPEDLQTTAAHEFGHALGISGHSDDPNDLMYPVEISHFNPLDQPLPGEAATVTAHDLRTLKECYPGLFQSSDRRP